MKKLKIQKKTVANLSKSQMEESYVGGAGTQFECLQTQNCTIKPTDNCASKYCSDNNCASGFLNCLSLAGTVCPTSGDVTCYTDGCTTTEPYTNNCTNVCK